MIWLTTLLKLLVFTAYDAYVNGECQICKK